MNETKHRFSQTIGMKQDFIHGFLADCWTGNYRKGMRRSRRSQEKWDRDSAQSSPFPLNFPFRLVSPRGNLFTVNTALMSRKDSKCQWDREKRRARQGRGSWENGRDEQSSRTSLAHKHKNTHAAALNSPGSPSGLLCAPEMRRGSSTNRK